MNPDEAIQAAELAEAETAYRHQLAREMYQAGRPAVHGISHADLEQRRWGPGGRAHFADPRPGDFPGRGAKPQPGHQAQPEMEAG